MRGRILFSMLAIGAAIAGPVTASRAYAAPTAYGPTACTPQLSVSPTNVGAGGTVTVSISGNCVNDTFTVTLQGTGVTLGTVTTNASGSGSGTFTIPTNVSGGSHAVTAADASGNTASMTIVITAAATASTAAPATAAKPLPFTGAQVTGLVAAGAVAIGAGGLLVLGSRRRKARFS